MTGSADTLLDILLRAVALFYAAGSSLGVRRIAMDVMLDRAIVAVGGKDEDEEARASRRRGLFNLGLLLLNGVACLFVLAMIRPGEWLVTAVAILNLAYLLVLAPAVFDPHDPPDPQARRKSYVAATVYALFAALCLLHGRQGGFSGLADAHPFALAAATTASLALIVHAIASWRQALTPSWSLKAAVADTVYSGEAGDAELVSLEEERALACARYKSARFVFNPALTGSPLVVADTGERLPDWPPVGELDDGDLDALFELGWALRDALDPNDPRRQRFASGAAEAGFLKQARDVFERVGAKIGADRLTFDPDIAAQKPLCQPENALLQARCGEGCFIVDGDRGDRVYPDELGMSFVLDANISAWCAEFAEACPKDETDGSATGLPGWRPDQWAAFDARGLALIERFRAELAETGRSRPKLDYLPAQEV